MDYYKIERINFMFIQVCLQIIQKFYYSFIRNIFHPHVRINTSIIITVSGNLPSSSGKKLKFQLTHTRSPSLN